MLKRWLKSESGRYDLIVIFLVILQFLIIYLAYRVDESFETLFWFCNHTPFLLAIFFYFRKKQLVKSIINVGLLFQFFWTIDFFSKIFFGFYIFGTTEYLFNNPYGWMIIIPIFSHLIMMNLSLIVTLNIKPKFTNLFYSTIYVLFLYAFTLNFTNPVYNINCVHKVCNLGYAFEGYTYLWPVFAFFLIILPTHYLQYLIYKLNVLLEKHNE